MRLEQPFVSAHGGQVLYKDVEYNEIMRGVGQAGHMALRWLKPGRALDEDPTLYLDETHLTEKGNEKIARLLLSAVEEVFEKEEISIHRTRQ